ncbi:unnamed protein product [Paramecium sonneborni]|uniref:Uncharacterized protein n=1 Tax=Paramecium sonneborni TaxID=65129 RepID=A0A8S1MFA2_9CILI|nr:unnamed protein product [Paramecium sonneborni]
MQANHQCQGKYQEYLKLSLQIIKTKIKIKVIMRQKISLSLEKTSISQIMVSRSQLETLLIINRDLRLSIIIINIVTMGQTSKLKDQQFRNYKITWKNCNIILMDIFGKKNWFSSF